jgi:ABC-type uncharacterized transport system substrate-binding protein
MVPAPFGTLSMVRWIAIAAALTICISPSPADAHPHAFIETTSGIVFSDDGKIEAINVEWMFDPNYTSFATEGLDANKDGVLTSEELRPLAKVNIESLKEWSYFVYGRLNGEKIQWADVKKYDTSMGKDGRLTMNFVVPAVTPIDPRTAKFLYRIYDPTFYIAIDFVAKHPVKAIGKKPTVCKIEVGPVPDPSQTADTKNMLATKGTDWTPEGEEDFGIMFAQPVSVLCGGGQ